MQRDNFGSFLLKCRKEKKLTQQQLAEKLYVSNSTIYKWEKGISMPRLDMYDKLAEILDVSADDLIYCAKNDTVSVVRETKIMDSLDCEKGSADVQKNRSKRIKYVACIFCVVSVLLV